MFYKPSGSPFLRSGQERVLQSLLCSVRPWVRSYRRILSAAAVSPCQMGNLVRLREVYPEIYEQFVETSESRRFSIKIAAQPAA